MGKIMLNGTQYGVGGIEQAKDISYDNTESGATATDVQGALDELNAGLTNIPQQKIDTTIITATGVTYAQLFTLTEIQTMFSDSTITIPEIMVTVTNGDFDTSPRWITATAWQGDNLMINFNQAVTGAIRVNYHIVIVRNS